MINIGTVIKLAGQDRGGGALCRVLSERRCGGGVSNTQAFIHFIILISFFFLLHSYCPRLTSRRTHPPIKFYSLPHYWSRCVGSGHALLGTRNDWRQHLIVTLL